MFLLHNSNLIGFNKEVNQILLDLINKSTENYINNVNSLNTKKGGGMESLLSPATFW